MRTQRSNRLETLVDVLSAYLETPLSSPLAEETILVPSSALGTWLAAEIAIRHGVCARMRFVTPRSWLAAVTAPADNAPDRFAPDTLAWSIAASWPGLTGEPAFAEVRSYLQDDPEGTKRLALATRVARVIDGYFLYRDELVRGWLRGDDDHWQARLVRAMVDKHGPEHQLARVDRMIEDVTGPRRTALPERLSLFSVGPLAPLVQRALTTIASVVPVDVFELVAGEPIATAGSLLGELQRGAPRAARTAIGVGDRSVSVHVCHGPRRECEVLRDQILAALHDDPTLEPRDVLVLCPDLETYAPAIDAVFGGHPKDPLSLPFRIGDRPAGAAVPVVDALLAVIDCATSRMAAPAVVDLLLREPIRTRFDLTELNVETIRGWVVDAGIRWAVDAQHRNEVDQPALAQNTWRFGLDRLLLGYAAGKEGDATFADVLPVDEIDGSSGAILGAFSSFCEALFALRAELQGRASLETWRTRITRTLERFVATSRKTETHHQLVRRSLDELVKRAMIGGFGEEVPLSVVRDALEADLAEQSARFTPGSGGISFVSLAPGRAVPSRIVALLGMNDGDFPRAYRPLGFDLVGNDPRPGDPSPRDDDRRVFGEALLGARDRLVITFVGRSIQNDAERPPSVVVSELLDAVDAAFDGESDLPARARVVVHHALHPFSPRYFREDTNDRLFSHVGSLGEAAKAMSAPRVPAPAFVTRALPPPPGEDSARPIAVDDLCSFFAHPVTAFVSKRVGVYLAKDVAPLADREPIGMDGLDRWAIQTELVARARAGHDVAEAPPGIRSSGRLPLGTPGAIAYEELYADPAEMGRLVADLLGVGAPPPLEVDLALEGGERILGWLRSVGPKGQVLHRYAKARGKHELDAWIRHLAMLAAGVAKETFLISRGDFGPVVQRLRNVKRPQDHLADLVVLHRLGQRVPLPIFPDPASEYAAKILAGKTEEQALSAARRSYTDGYDGVQNDYVRKVYGEGDPLDPAFRLFAQDAAERDTPPAFATIARRVFGPLLEHLEEV